MATRKEQRRRGERPSTASAASAASLAGERPGAASATTAAGERPGATGMASPAAAAAAGERLPATPARKKPLLLLILAAAGPGIIAELAGNDAGGISTFSVAGASFGYHVLWTVPVAMLFLMVVQECAARMGAQTGKGFAALIRENFGVRLTSLAMCALLVSNTATTLSEFAGIAAAMELFGVNKYISVPVAGLAVWALLMSGSYRRTERVFLVISLVFVTYVAAAFLSGPAWGEVAMNTVVPQLVFDKGFFALVIAIIGTTIAPWMIFFGQSNVVEKGAQIRELFLQRVDVFSGAVAACLVVWFIIITTATVLYGQGIAVDDAAAAARALEPMVGPFAEQLFAIGLLGASFLAACVLPQTTAYALCEAFGWERGADRSWAEAPVYKTLLTAVIAIGCFVVLVPGIDLMGIMLTAQVINGVLLPVLLVFMLRLANNRRVMGAYRNGRLANSLTTVAIVVVIALTAILFVMQALGLG
ncbi:MAG: Nramp family divalent metal transporter [Coriobacteriales bacterium]|jgi:Mn2+/Fe2+ NRAMP family transporter|nr:Nramp family divalent metal transporter [Coriobacteriales bacterium]